MIDLTVQDVGFAPESTADLSIDNLVRIALTLDVEPLGKGDPLPLLWHWAAFTPMVPTAALGPDGHSKVPAALKDHPRRMWGSGSITLEAPLRAGEPATRHSTVADARTVEGRTGSLVIVTVEHTHSQHDELCVRERQSIVYRAAAEPVALPEGDVIPDCPHDWLRRERADEALMFRYSAVTFNSHRIHYDHRYATTEEGYPELVFPGPLSALLLAREATTHAGAPLSQFTFKATAPVFAGSRFTLIGSQEGTSGAASIIRNDGAVAMEASFEINHG